MIALHRLLAGAMGASAYPLITEDGGKLITQNGAVLTVAGPLVLDVTPLVTEDGNYLVPDSGIELSV